MRYVHFENMTWPNYDDDQLAWRMIHAPGTLTEADLLVAASYIGAYKALLERTQKERNDVCKKIRLLSAYGGGLHGKNS